MSRKPHLKSISVILATNPVQNLGRVISLSLGLEWPEVCSYSCKTTTWPLSFTGYSGIISRRRAQQFLIDWLEPLVRAQKVYCRIIIQLLGRMGIDFSEDSGNFFRKVTRKQ